MELFQAHDKILVFLFLFSSLSLSWSKQRVPHENLLKFFWGILQPLVTKVWHPEVSDLNMMR